MKRYDLNLLVALDALLHEGSVSGAARRIGIGQPAMSAALSRLRAMFQDPLLVRSGAGMNATARARDLAEPLAAALAQLDALVEPTQVFDAFSATRSFRVSGGDYVGMTILPGLAALLATEAPRIDIRLRSLEKDAALAALHRDEIDVALLVKEQLPAEFDSEILIRESFVGAARTGHPVLSAGIDAVRFASCGHVLITERGDATGTIDTALAASGLSRRIAVTIPSALLVAGILRVTDLVATLPRRAGQMIARGGDIVLFETPVPTPGWAMRMVWARRNAKDPALAWLRSSLRSVAAVGGFTAEPHGGIRREI